MRHLKVVVSCWSQRTQSVAQSTNDRPAKHERVNERVFVCTSDFTMRSGHHERWIDYSLMGITMFGGLPSRAFSILKWCCKGSRRSLNGISYLMRTWVCGWCFWCFGWKIFVNILLAQGISCEFCDNNNMAVVIIFGRPSIHAKNIISNHVSHLFHHPGCLPQHGNATWNHQLTPISIIPQVEWTCEYQYFYYN